MSVGKATLFLIISLLPVRHLAARMPTAQQLLNNDRRTAEAASHRARKNKCSVPKALGGKYKLISAGHSLGEPVILGLRVVVKPKNFNRDYMMQLARRINSEYCNDENITVTIFDDDDAAKSPRKIVDFLVGRDPAPELRGFYSLDRKTGKEGIQFSTARGKPTDEVVIDLSSKRGQP